MIAILLLACSSSSGPETTLPVPNEAGEHVPNEVGAPDPGAEADANGPENTAPATASVPSGSEGAPSFSAEVVALPAELIGSMRGVSWKEGCPVPLEDLALMRVSHWDFQGTVRTGELVIAARHAEVYTDVLRQAFEAKYPIERMRPVHHYGGDDDASMKANNTSAFNCRQKTTSAEYSEHSFGHAIDINPLINPFVTTSGRVYPPEGAEWADRSRDFPGKIDADSVLVKAFAAHGWPWGGNWSKSKDYQHFSLTGK